MWPTWTALALVWVVSLSGLNWVWAILFLSWAGWDVYTGESHFVQRVRRDQSPVAFWTVVASWVALSILWIAWPA